MKDAVLDSHEYLTYEPVEWRWIKGEACLRLVVPAGQQTDYASVPTKGLLGWLSRKLGFRPDTPALVRASKIHDALCFVIKYYDGIIEPDYKGLRYEYQDPKDKKWRPCINSRWRKKEAHKVWMTVAIEDGFPPKKAKFGYQMLCIFNPIHSMFN